MNASRFRTVGEHPQAIFRSAGQFGVRKPIALVTACQLAMVRLEVGASNTAGQLRIVALAVPYGKLSSDFDGAMEVFENGCFAESLAVDDLRVLFNHNPDYVLGRTQCRTAIFYEDFDGLHFEAEPPETNWAGDLLISMDRGDINQADALFYVLKSRLEYSGSQKIRVIEKAKLIEASVTSFSQFDAPSAKIVNQNQLAAGAQYLSPRTGKGAPVQ
jgi:HK97 family phage prohead protease